MVRGGAAARRRFGEKNAGEAAMATVGAAPMGR
jgi:hypothetical protein